MHQKGRHPGDTWFPLQCTETIPNQTISLSPPWNGLLLPPFEMYSTASRRPGSEADTYRLDFGIVLKHLVAVDPDGAGAQSRGKAMRLAQIIGPDATAQTVHGLVGLWQHVLDVLKRQGYQHRAKDLFLHHPHVLLDIHQHGGLEKVALLTVPLAPAQGRGPFSRADIKVAADAAELLIGDQRAHLRRRIHARSQLDPLGLLSHARNDLVKDLVLDVEARASAATLTMIEENRMRGTLDGQFRISILEHDIGGLATQFERDLLEVANRRLHDHLAHFSGASKGDLIDLGMSRERTTRLRTIPGEDIHHPFGEVGFLNQLTQAQG